MTSIHKQPLKDLLDQFRIRFMTLLFDIEATDILPVHGDSAFGHSSSFGATATVDEFTLHLILLTSGATGIAERMLLHNAWLRLKLGMPVMSTVVYTGNGKHNIPRSVKGYGMHFKMWIHDARDMSPDFFLSSNNPADSKFAILAGREKDKSSLIREILGSMHSAFTGNPVAFQENTEQLKILSALRGEKLKLQVEREMKDFQIFSA